MRPGPAAVLLALTVGLGAVAGCAPDHGDNEVVVWTVNSGNDQVATLEKIADRYEQRSGTSVRVVRAPSRDDGDVTQIVTAVRGGTGPDVYLADRFGTAQFAALGLVESIQDLVDREPAGFLDDYLAYAVNEATYNGQLYALPFDTDTRALYYNKRLVREAGFDPEVLDPKNGAPTLDQVWEIADKITATADNGSYDRVGFFPWGDQAWPFTWGLKNQASFYDQPSCTIPVDDPGFRRIYTDYAQWAEKLDYAKVDAFEETYQPENAPDSQSGFFQERLGFTINYSNYIFNLAKYAPDLDWGVTYLPVEREGDRPYSWSGGFGWTVPTGAENREGGWDFMKFASGPEGQKIWAMEQKYLPTYAPLLSDPEAVGENVFFASILLDNYSTSRPALPIGADLWVAMNTGREAVLIGDSTPDEALREIRRRLQPQLDPYCPVTLAQNR